MLRPSIRLTLLFIMLCIISRTFSFVSWTYRHPLRTSTRFVSSISNSDVARTADMSSALTSTTSTLDPEDFLFGGQTERLSFTDMEVHPTLIAALSTIDKQTATNIQRKSFAPIIAGKDTVIGAETGSGKTLSYMIPILHKLITATSDDDESNDESSSSTDDDDTENEEVDEAELLQRYGGDNKENYPQAIIMVPNKELAMQVEDMVRPLLLHLDEAGIKDSRGNPLEVEAMTATEERWPYRGRGTVCPQVMICTPTFMGKFCKGGSNILEPALFELVSTLVLDEADMLLDGSYLNTITKVLEAFRLTRRAQYILSAATIPNYGLKSLDRFVQKKFPEAVRVSNDYLHKHHPQITQLFHPVDATPPQEGETEECGEDRDMRNDVFTPARLAQLEASIVDGEQTMVFVNTAGTARELGLKLRAHDFTAVEFHKNVPYLVKAQGLELFRRGQIPLLICTDAAARGLDLSNVRHVIQAQFALNVVQYLHRIGRASRAGKTGKATSFYDDGVVDLVTVIRDSGADQGEIQLAGQEEGEESGGSDGGDGSGGTRVGTLDKAFSRNRSFKTKIKKTRRASSPREE